MEVVQLEIDVQGILEKFNIKSKKIIPINSKYIVETKKNIYILKKIKVSERKILFIHWFKNHLLKNGFRNIDKYIITKENKYVKHNNSLFVLTKWIDGRRGNTYDYIDVIEASKTLGLLHRASKGYKPPSKAKIISNLGKWQEILLKRCEDFTYMKCLVEMKKVKSYSDYLFLENYNMIYNRAVESIKSIQENNYFSRVNIDGKDGYVCHGNYNLNNIVVDEKKKYHVIGFEKCRFEIRAFDLINFIITTMNELNWDFNIGGKIIENYDQVRTLDKDEYKIIFSFLQFPFSIWGKLNKYYFEDISQAKVKYQKDILKILENIENKQEFIKEYKKTFL